MEKKHGEWVCYDGSGWVTDKMNYKDGKLDGWQYKYYLGSSRRPLMPNLDQNVGDWGPSKYTSAVINRTGAVDSKVYYKNGRYYLNGRDKNGRKIYH